MANYASTLRDTPRAWVGCLACYNAGDLVGDWVDGEEAAEHIPCTKVEYGSPHEEFWCMDHECLPMISGECSPQEFTDATEWFNDLREECGNEDAMMAWLTTLSGDDWRRTNGTEFTDKYRGEADNSRQFAMDQHYDIVDDNIKVVWPYTCIDWQHAASELMCDYTEVHYQGTSYFFDAH
jgi:hypothetical protein